MLNKKKGGGVEKEIVKKSPNVTKVFKIAKENKRNTYISYTWQKTEKCGLLQEKRLKFADLGLSLFLGLLTCYHVGRYASAVNIYTEIMTLFLEEIYVICSSPNFVFQHFSSK